MPNRIVGKKNHLSKAYHLINMWLVSILSPNCALGHFFAEYPISCSLSRMRIVKCRLCLYNSFQLPEDDAKDNVKLEFRDYLALFIAALETVLAPFLIIMLVLLLILLALLPMGG